MDRAPSHFPRHEAILAIACAFALGLIARGFLVRNVERISPIRVVSDERPLAPTIVIEGVRNGAVKGIIRGGTRLILGDIVVMPDGSGAFSLPAAQILVNEIGIAVPSGMRFVASRRGKYYYLVESSAGARLSPGNRTYFPDKASAERAGYVEYRP